MSARTRIALVLLAAGSLVAADCIAASPTLDRIKATGTITLGYRDGAAPFSARQRTGQVRGYSVELCEKIAAAVGRSLGIPELKVVWKPVDSETRIADVAARKIDAECGSTTITLSRMERVDFSVPIFVDGGSALVRAGRDAPTAVAGLAGKRVGVMPSTTTETALRKALSVAGVTATIVPVKDGAEGVAALLAGKVDAYASDRMLLAQLRLNEPKAGELAFLESDFSYEPYGIVLPRDDPDFRLLANRTLVALYKSGEIDPIFIRWLGPYGNPGALLNAMFYLNAYPE
jgi:ABC-type amino acid transport substrate-binding protein